MPDKTPIKLGMVAGEVSGDLLGAALLAELTTRSIPYDARGIGGRAMLDQGFSSRVPMEKLSVMGLVEVLKHLRELLGIRRDVTEFMNDFRPDVFIGIDSPDFNLKLESNLRKKGLKTVHYVSPTVWAWRKKRVKKVAEAVDLVLTLFPFEADFYRNHRVPVEFVGHPLADRLVGLGDERAEVRKRLGIGAQATVLAVLPGSRGSELDALGERFAHAIALCVERNPDLVIIAPMASERIKTRFRTLLNDQGVADRVELLDGESHDAMIASNAVLLASGTAALEAMLLDRPMVVAYGFTRLTYAMLRRTDLGRMSHYSLPNILAGEGLVPELIQEEATAENLADAVMDAIEQKGDWSDRLSRFRDLSNTLKRDASARAADAVLELAGPREGAFS